MGLMVEIDDTCLLKGTKNVVPSSAISRGLGQTGGSSEGLKECIAIVQSL